MVFHFSLTFAPNFRNRRRFRKQSFAAFFTYFSLYKYESHSFININIIECQAITQKFDVEHNCHCICVIAEIYDPEKDSYIEVPHPCTSLSDMSLAIIGNEAYSVGGESQPEHFWFGGCSTSNSASDEVWKYT